VSTDRPLPPAPPVRGRYREAWVGLFVVVGLVATLVTLALMTDAALFRGRYIVTTDVPNASGIRKGDPVQMRGVNIGRILGFAIRHDTVEVRLEIEGEYKIPEDSRVEIKANGLLGGMVADVIPGTSARSLGWGGRLEGRSGIGLFDKMDSLAGQADKVAVKIQNLLSDETVHDLQGGASAARQSLDELRDILRAERGDLRALTASLRRSAEGMERVTTGPELERTVKKVDALAERLDGTLATLDGSAKSLESILGRMDRGEGLLGKLSRDDELYRNATQATASINKAAQELQALVADVRQQPKKYLKLEIF
jgi:phospholipid/cholesterol/gamma-HCH transport system substrate-binding protein